MNSNNWQKDMFDHFFAAKTIGSKIWAEKGKAEADFVLKVLNLPAEAKILDLPCGTGRHAVQFATRGYFVTGIDISRSCINIAKKQSRHKNVTYKIGDMSKLAHFRGKFDAVTNLFTSFGYFSTDEENSSVLKGMVKCLKPGGKIIINTINRNFLLSIYKPALWSIVNDVATIQASIYDPKTRYNESYICMVNEKTNFGTARYHRIRLYSPSEIVALMKESGCKSVSVWGDFQGKKLDNKKSTHPIYVGVK